MAVYGFNYRGTSGGATDGAGETYVIGDMHPTTRGGHTFGWLNGPPNFSNRSGTTTPRLFGMNWQFNTGTQYTWRLELAQTGDHELNAAFGDPAANALVYAEFFDNATSFKNIAGVPTTDAEYFVDANGTERTSAQWLSSATKITRTFASQILDIRICSPTNVGSSVSGLVHLTVEELGGGGSGATVATDVGVLTVAGFAPTIAVTAHQTVQPGVGVLAVAGFEPTIAISAHQVVLPDTGALVVAGFAPTILTPQLVAPGAGVLAVTGFEPTILTGTTVAPDVGEITITGFAPSIVTPQSVSPGAGAATFDGYAPTILTPTVVIPSVGEITATGFEPTILTPRVVQPGTGDCVAIGYAPILIAPVSVAVGTGQAIAAGFAPTIITNTIELGLPPFSVTIREFHSSLTLREYHHSLTLR